jgi:hypothetical protein
MVTNGLKIAPSPIETLSDDDNVLGPRCEKFETVCHALRHDPRSNMRIGDRDDDAFSSCDIRQKFLVADAVVSVHDGRMRAIVDEHDSSTTHERRSAHEWHDATSAAARTVHRMNDFSQFRPSTHSIRRTWASSPRPPR